MTFVAPPPNATYTDVVDAAFGYTRDTDPATWVFTDISRYVVMTSPITIRKGRPDATSTSDPCQINLTLDNTDGRFTTGNPLSPYWPHVVRGVPIRVRRTWHNATTSYERAVAFVSGWPLTPQAGLRYVTVDITAFGRLRWLQRDGTLLASTLRRVVSASSPTAYWSLEDGSDATGGGSLVPGVRPMRVGGTVAFGQSGVGGTAAVADMSGGGTLYGSLSGGVATNHWGVLCGFQIQDTTSTRAAYPIYVTTSTGMALTVLVTFAGAGTGTAVDVYAVGPGAGGTGGNVVNGGGDAGNLLQVLYNMTTWQVGTFHTILVYTFTTAGGFNVGAIVDGVDSSGPFPTGLLSDMTGNPGALRQIHANPDGADFGYIALLDDPSVVSNAIGVAHIAAWQPFNHSTTITIGGASSGYDGESATARIARLGTQNSIPVTTSAGIGTPQPLGPQAVDSLGNVFAQAADADCGLLHDGGPLGGLVYASPGARYNVAPQLTVVYALSQISDDFTGTDDDQSLTNDVTVTRTNGSSGRWVNTASTAIEGQIGTGDTLNLHDDQQPDKVAQFRANLSSFDAMRFPQVPIDLRRNPELVEAFTNLTLPAYLAITGVPSPYPPLSIDQFAEGYTETLDVDTWQVVFNCSPAAPWRVMVLDDTTNPFRLDADSLVVNAGVSASATSFGLKTNGGAPLVSTSGADYPVLVLDVATGEVMRLKTVTGVSSPQTATVDRAINGVSKALGTNDPIVLYRPAGFAL